MLKPKVGDFYLIFEYQGLETKNVIEILGVEGNKAFYRTIADDSGDAYRFPWDFITHPYGVARKLYPLEIELL